MDPKPALKPGCRLSPAGDVLLIPEGALRLEGPALHILKACDGGRTIDEVVTALQIDYPHADAAQMKQQTIVFLQQLAERGAIEFL